jgi:hypothetical protein
VYILWSVCFVQHRVRCVSDGQGKGGNDPPRDIGLGYGVDVVGEGVLLSRSVRSDALTGGHVEVFRDRVV